VLVLEREQVGWGASSRNGGQVLTGLKVEPAALVARYGEARARALFDMSLESIDCVESLIARESIDCDYETSGHLQAACKPSHFAAMREEQALLARVFHHRVELVPKSAQRTELGSDVYHGLLVDERSRAINPARYVMGLAEAARRAGAVIAEQTPVLRMARQGRRWKVTTSHGEIDAGDVLMATNGYTDGAMPALQRRLVPIGSYVIATEPLEAALAHALLPRRRMAFDSKHFLYYFRLTQDRRLLFGGRAEFSRPTDGTTRRAAAILQRGMKTVFPDLAGARVDFAWGGTVAFTRDQMPHAGRLGGAYYAGGYCGHGIAMATYLGEVVARRLAGETAVHPLVDDSGGGFAPIPLYRGNPWFLPVAGAYYRLLDVLQ
jgi:glycine/D-amino acid oxidase-like deaminating enzyme